VSPDVLLTSGVAAETLDRILGQELSPSKKLVFLTDQKDYNTHSFAQLLGLFAERLGVGDVVVGDGGEKFLLVLTVEWRLPDEHFI